MIAPEVPLVVFGAGSIGERHATLLRELGYLNVALYRQRQLPLRTLPADAVRTFTQLSEVEEFGPYAAIISTPTAQHLEQTTWCVERGLHVLVEKPLSHTTQGIAELSQHATEKNVLVQTAYMLRYHPLLQRLKGWIDAEAFGPLLSFQSTWAEYLPHWHPWEDYRTSYAARRALGGGVALTLSHDLDLAHWLVGTSASTWQRADNYRSSLEVDTEAGATFLLTYPHGVTGTVHLNYYQQVPQRRYEYTFERALVVLDYYASTLTVQTPEGKEEYVAADFERNDLFREQLLDFFRQTQLPHRAVLSQRYLRESEVLITQCTQ
ncbi:hypothetical protein GCM10027275_30220 [Rhabdobacter roseus]|uniref:Putative dehydrogenase n=1 Tax=Rhabdobacter roseus TaxID=1655419 RepID=A0A840TZC2_9BACT|nr:Gfo/Idh/MocA family oxidoreductase [Rhabdobacter roseus]MBB5284979.1 putative dehydrogenase [Rhabdobacter roseus]